MKSIYRRELRRKIIHILTGVLFIASAFIFKDIDAIFWLGIILLVPFGIFYLLIRWFNHTRIGQLAHTSIEREPGHHTNGIGGLSFVGGVILSYLLFGFNPAIVVVSIIVLAFGDGFASYVGMRFGKHKFNIEGHTKSIEGTIAGIVAATVVSSLFIDFFLALIAVALTMIVELVGIRVRGREIPDNLYIPVISGLVLYILVMFV
jgi:phytol kinase